jgi:nitrogenase molybdenum-iron protein NifN
MPQLLHEYKTGRTGPGPRLVNVSTPSYRGTHADGFHTAVRGVVEALTERSSTGATPGSVAIVPGFVSAADLRELRALAATFGLRATLVPDYSDTLDGGSWREYERIPPGGTTLEEVRALGASAGVIECGRVLAGETRTAGTHLASLGVHLHRVGLPIGLRESDRFCAALSRTAGGGVPPEITAQRGRLIDAMVDGHKYVSSRRAVVFGEEDFVIGLASFLCEIGVYPVLCASGGRSRRFAAALRQAVPDLPESAVILEGADFAEIEHAAASLRPDLLVGNSKGYGLARSLGLPLLRCGFPIHDRLGGHRLLHLGYAGATQLYDSLVNLLLARKQESSPIGYSYL